MCSYRGSRECEPVYLPGSVIASSGRAEPDVDRRVAQASRAFGALHKAVFGNKDLRVETKRAVYQACVLALSPAVWV